MVVFAGRSVKKSLQKEKFKRNQVVVLCVSGHTVCDHLTSVPESYTVGDRRLTALSQVNNTFKAVHWERSAYTSSLHPNPSVRAN